MYLDPQTIQWLLIGGASFCAYMIGRSSTPKVDDIIESTIVYLIHNNYVKAKRDENGEWDLIQLDEK